MASDLTLGCGDHRTYELTYLFIACVVRTYFAYEPIDLFLSLLCFTRCVGGGGNRLAESETRVFVTGESFECLA